MALGNILGIIGIGLSVASAVGSIFAAKKEAKIDRSIVRERNRAIALEEKRDRLAARKEAIEQVRKHRIARAAAKNAAVNQGLSIGAVGAFGVGSASGAIGGISSNLTKEIGFLAEGAALGTQANTIFARIAELEGKKAGVQSDIFTLAGVGSFGNKLTTNSDKIATIFS